MSPSKRADAMKNRARQAAGQLKPAAERARPLAASAAAAGRRQLLRTRAWAAPQVERSGQVLQDSVAPKVSGMLARAARRMDPAQPRQRRWRKPAGLAALTAAGSAAAGGAAAFIRRRRQPASQPTSAADSTAATMPNGQQSPTAASKTR